MSDDDIDTGPIVTGEVAPAPSETPRVPAPDVSDEKGRTEQIREQFNAGLGLMAHGTESAEDYIKERKTQERFLNDEDLSGAQMQEWHQRTHSALQRAADAAARARGEVPPSQQPMSEDNIPGYVSPDDPNYEAIIDANKDRFSEYFDNPERTGNSASWQEHKKSVTDWITFYDPKNVLIGHFMGSPLGPQMMEALEGEGEAIRYLANLPPQKRAVEMSKLEGYVHAQQMLQQQAPQQPQVRQQTAAPPIIRSPKGSANVPQDLHSLASRGENVDAYVKMRQAQNKRSKD